VVLAAASCGETTTEGFLEIGIADDFESGRSWREYTLRLDDGRVVELDLADLQAPEATADARVRVTGEWSSPQRIKGAILTPLANPAGTGVTRSALLPPATPVVRRVAALVFNFSDLTTQPITPDEIRTQLFTGASSAKAYYEDNFYRWITLQGLADPNGDVFGYYTIPSASSPCNQTTWGTEARAAALAAGVDLSLYDHVVHFFPRTSACSWGGYGQSSGGTMAPTGNFNYGRYTWVNSDNPGSVTNHEFDHNFRMSHSSTNNCTEGGTRVSLGSTCMLNEYGSRFDVMGSNVFRHSNAYNKARAGVLGPANILTVRQGGTYAIQPIELPVACGTQAIRIARTTSEYYYVDYHQRIGIDAAYAETAPIVNGVLLYLGGNYAQGSSNTKMLDTTPATTTFDDAPLLVGQTYSDPAGLVTITLESRDASAAHVKVVFPGGDIGPNIDGCEGGGTGGASGSGGATGGGGRGGTGGTGVGSGGRGGTGGTTGTAGRGGTGGTGGATGPSGTGGLTAAGTGGAASGAGGRGISGGGGGTVIGSGGATGAGGTTGVVGSGGSFAGTGGTSTPVSGGRPDAVTGGCGCRVGDSEARSPSTWMLFALAAVVLCRRYRRLSS
jgi:hypothetical protein